MKKSGKKPRKSGSSKLQAAETAGGGKHSSASGKKCGKSAAFHQTMPVETYFLRYAFPCTFIIRQRGRVSEHDFERLEKLAYSGKKPPRKLLENTYDRAFGRLKQVAKSMGRKSYWDYGVVREYFVNRHNSMIAEGDFYKAAPKEIRDLCKTRRARIVDGRDGFLVVRYGKGKTRVVSSAFLTNPKIGDTVIIHYGYAIEKA